MLELAIPGRSFYRLAHLALELNGTLALFGRLIDGVAEWLRTLREQLQVHVLTADIFCAAAEIEKALGIPDPLVRSSADKRAFVEQLGAESVVAVGNDASDGGMLSLAALAIAILGPEGLARETLESADVAVPGILPALDPLLHSRRLVAILRF